MKLVVLLATIVGTVALTVPAGAAEQRPRPSQQSSAKAEPVADAYAQFLLGHYLEDNDDQDGAIAAYKRARELDPAAADISAELAALYLRENKVQEAMTTAEEALKVDAANQEANRVLGIVYAALSENGRPAAGRSRGSSGTATGASDQNENVTKAIHHLELAIAHPLGEADPNVRATLARLYVRTGAYEKAIPILTDLVNQEQGWQEGPTLLAEAYAASGRTSDAISLLEERSADDPRVLATLADFYERERRWADAANAYSRALENPSRGMRVNEVKTRYAAALLNAGGHESLEKARDVLNEIVSTPATANDARALYLLSQAQRRLGDFTAAEATARRVITQSNENPWGYFALAETLEERHQYQSLVDELAPVVTEWRKQSSDQSFELSLLLPHLGFAYQELGQSDKAISTFEEARRLAPDDPTVAGYLIDANLAAKKYPAALEVAKAASKDHPDDVRLTRLHAQALRHNGQADQGITLLEEQLKKHVDDPSAYIALAQLYLDVERGGEAVRVLHTAQEKFPSDNTVAFELGAAFDKQKNFSDAEAAFHQVLARDPDNGPALNYLGYMLADRGERLDESVGYLKKALQLEPENGSYLDSLGWAYFKSDKLDLAEDNLHRAADQLKSNSVIQEHYGEVLFKLGKFNDAIAAFNRALSGDGDSIDRPDIDKRIRAARQKLNKK
ncbi:MAG TPA: tetratricopeptide repeat protein [Vicinamibacterales bacterium]|nr:tetratricopeptide repeat protein [Vicinamibacterales bacterium]